MATKEAYEKKLQAQLGEWEAKLDVLGAKARSATADARVSYENELESLKSKRLVARQKLDELDQRGEDAWEDRKDGVEDAWDEMGKAIDKLASRFN